MWFFKKKHRIDTVFFDIGGVVVDAPTAHYLSLGSEIFGCQEDALNRVASPLIAKLETGAISSPEFWERLCEDLKASGVDHAVPPWRFKGFWEGILMDHLKVDQGILHLARRLRAKVKVAALSNTIEEHALALQREGIYEHFNPVVLSCKSGSRKPEAKIYLKAAKLTDTKPERCLLIDDLEENVEGARAVGFSAHLYTDREELAAELSSLGIL